MKLLKYINSLTLLKSKYALHYQYQIHKPFFQNENKKGQEGGRCDDALSTLRSIFNNCKLSIFNTNYNYENMNKIFIILIISSH